MVIKLIHLRLGTLFSGERKDQANASLSLNPKQKATCLSGFKRKTVTRHLRSRKTRKVRSRNRPTRSRNRPTRSSRHFKATSVGCREVMDKAHSKTSAPADHPVVRSSQAPKTSGGRPKRLESAVRERRRPCWSGLG